MPTELDKPGIIRFSSGSQVVSTHYRSELFDDGPLTLNGGLLTLSDGFVASLAEDLDAGEDVGFNLGGSTLVDVQDDVDSIKKLALSLAKRGDSVGDVFGDGDVEISIVDTPENIQALLNGPSFALFDSIASIQVSTSSEEPLRIPLDIFDDEASLFSDVSDIEVFGTIQDYISAGGISAPDDDRTVDFYVEDDIQGYIEAFADGITTADSAFIALTPDDGFRVVDSVINLVAADTSLSGTGFDTAVTLFGVKDTIATIVTAISNEDLPEDVDSYILRDSVTSLSTLSGTIPDGAVDGVIVVDSLTNLNSSAFTNGYLPNTTQIILSGTTDELASILTGDSPIELTAGLTVTGIEVLDGGDDALELSFDDIVALGLESISVNVEADFNLIATADQLDTVGRGAGFQAEVLERLENPGNVDLVVRDNATAIDDALASLNSYDEDVLSILSGFDLIDDGSDALGLFLDVALFSEDGETTAYPDAVDGPLEFNALDAATFIGVEGSASLFLDGDTNVGDYLNQRGDAMGFANLFVDDDAASLRALEDDLNLLNTGDSTSFLIQGIPVQFTHFVSFDDIATAGPDSIEYTADDVGEPDLVTFDGATDYYILDSDVVSSGGTVNIGGTFEEGLDVIDIANFTGIFSSTDLGSIDVSFVSPDLLGNRALLEAGRNPADIAIDGSEGETLIEFDGFGDAYDGIAGLTINLTESELFGSVSVESPLSDSFVSNGLTENNFFGLPAINNIVYDEVEGVEGNIETDEDFLRFNSYNAFGSAMQVFGHLQAFYDGSLDLRQSRVDTVFNIEGDIVLGVEDETPDDTLFGDAQDVFDDVLFGLSGNDTIYGLTGDDYASGGDGNDDLYGAYGYDELWGDAGNDALYGGDSGDDLYGGYGNDTLYGEDGEDVLYGDFSADSFLGGADTLYGGFDSDILYGDYGDDELYGEEGGDFLYGGYGNDTLSGGDGDDYLDGGAGNDTADYSGTVSDLVINLSLSSDQADGEDTGIDQLFNIENVTGGDGEDLITGDFNANVLIGNDADDQLYGLEGADTLKGGEGNDILVGGYGDDVLQGGAGTDTIDGGMDNDTISGGDGQDNLTGGSGQDVFTFAAQSEFGDTIFDFDTGSDIIEIARGALPNAALFSTYGVSSPYGSALERSDVFFALQSSEYGDYGYQFSGVGTSAAADILQALPNVAVPIFADGGIQGNNLTLPNAADYDFAGAFSRALSGVLAPTRIELKVPNPPAWTVTEYGETILVATPPTTRLLTTSVDANFIAFGIVTRASEGSTSTALVMAFINNDADKGVSIGGLNSVTINEISAFTVALFPTNDSDEPLFGDIFIV
ncbi:MAG: hypothetical protein AAGI24_03380 [Pseudomonadota bacterium]